MSETVIEPIDGPEGPDGPSGPPPSEDTNILGMPIVSSDNGKLIDATIEDLFEVVSNKIRLSIANGKLSPDNFQTILLKVVETIEDLSAHQVSSLSGTEKRAIAVNVTRMVIEDLHEHGHIDDEVYGWLSLGITFLAPTLFSGMKALYTKMQDVAEDIGENGTSGCCRRNFFNKKQ